MPRTGTPSSKTVGSTCGASVSYTEYGDPERMTPTKRRGRTVPPVTENIARTLGAESEVLDLLGTRHQLRVDVKLTASSCDEVTVLQR